MKNLILITSNYPFGNSDPFPGTELPYLINAFEKIILISQNSSSKQLHVVPGGIKLYRYNTSTSLAGFFKIPILIAANRRLIKEIFLKETSFRKASGFRLKPAMKGFLFKKIIKAIQLRDYIKDVLKEEKISGSTVFYSYWLNSGAHAVSLIEYPGSIKIARAHGSDLYEEATDRGFLPLFPLLAEKLNSIFFISEAGKKYFSAKRITGMADLMVSRLGIEGTKAPIIENNEQLFRIVSCSNLIPLKRVHLIIEALGLVQSDREIAWTHFGSGSELEKIKNLVEDLKISNHKIKTDLKGYVPNREILNFYSSKKISLFLNTSSTEGLPVSIMEAQSFGIPVIATDVGGVNEIVTGGTGFLLPVDFKSEDLAHKIEYFLSVSPGEEKKIRENAFNSWKQKFDASVNYPDFIKSVNRIFDPISQNSAAG